MNYNENIVIYVSPSRQNHPERSAKLVLGHALKRGVEGVTKEIMPNVEKNYGWGTRIRT
jgi:hypothetical protein